MRGAIPLLPQYAFMAWYLVKHRDFTLTFYLHKRRKIHDQISDYQLFERMPLYGVA
jgi:hypothetical protein